MKSSSRLKQVAVCIHKQDGNERLRLRGIAAFAHQQDWQLILVRCRENKIASELSYINPDGILTYVARNALVKASESLSIPLVDTATPEMEIPMWVGVDDAEAGRLAAQSLARSGLKNFGYCGLRGHLVSTARQRYFTEHLQKYGFVPAVFARRIVEYGSQMKLLRNWLESLPKPVGLLVFDDQLAERVLTACKYSGISVPDMVSMLGIGNDNLIATLTRPSLSTIDVPAERIGFEAARILHNAMNHLPIKTPQLKIEPAGVTMRGTTNILISQDSIVESAAQYIREHYQYPIGVEQIADFVRAPRRTLDRRFIKALGHSVHKELTIVRMQKACQLLSDSQESIGKIAEMCGFRETASFSRAFHREIGCWPINHRRRLRG
ncbi:MAG: substrate-binding domain-containing protein [Sedimentisphaerales bacterium]|nr:substrate-binding domain-containing protein [Sedimentisphaerales bacterium]